MSYSVSFYSKKISAKEKEIFVILKIPKEKLAIILSVSRESN
jgi:hypothetical protein